MPSFAEAVETLRQDRHFEAVVGDPTDAALVETLCTLFQANQILAAIPDGVAVVDFDLKIRWANPTFQAWCGGTAVGRGFYEALGSPQVTGPDFCPFHTALTGPLPDPGAANPAAPPAAALRLHCRNSHYFDLHVTPVYQPDKGERLVIVVGRDVTALVLQQQKLDALHKAGRELAALSADQLAEMSVPERIELFKLNIRRFTRDLLHYEIVEIRLLDPQDRPAPAALARGYDGRGSRSCPLRHGRGPGRHRPCRRHRRELSLSRHPARPALSARLAGRRSSLTVPLDLSDQTIGTFNVESPLPERLRRGRSAIRGAVQL